jgi:multiple sugar transport system permease protein
MAAPAPAGMRTRPTAVARWRSGNLTEGELAAVLLTPCVCFLAVFAFYPIFNALWTSLHAIRLDRPETGFPFIGFGNFGRAFADADARHAVGVTLQYVLVTVSAQFLIGLGIALVIHKTVRGEGFVRAAALLPWTLPPALAGQMWRWLFNDAGVINDVLRRTGAASAPIVWLGTPHLAFFAVSAAATWGAGSYMALILLAALQNIPDELYEASSLDGASSRRAFFAITLPMLRPAILVALVLRTLQALQAFDLPFAMTSGGPGNATETFALYIYKNTFEFLDFGYGAALSVVLLAMALAFALTYRRILAGRE